MMFEGLRLFRENLFHILIMSSLNLDKVHYVFSSGGGGVI